MRSWGPLLTLVSPPPSLPRFYQPEHSLMRQTVHMKGLPGTDAVFAGGALRNLAVACSHPDIIAGAGSSGLVGGAERDEVRGKGRGGMCCFLGDANPRTRHEGLTSVLPASD